MPQLDVSTFLPQLVWLAITFIVLYLLMWKLGLPRVDAIIAARRKRLDDDLARATEIKAEAEAVIAAYQKTLAEARAQAQAAIKDRAIPGQKNPCLPRNNAARARRARLGRRNDQSATGSAGRP